VTTTNEALKVHSKMTKYKFPTCSSYYILDNRAKIEVIPDKVHIIGNYEKKGDTEMLIYLEFLLTHHKELGKRDTDNFFSHVLVISDCKTRARSPPHTHTRARARTHTHTHTHTHTPHKE